MNRNSFTYTTADGNVIEITLEQYLSESPNNTEEKFNELKNTLSEFSKKEATANWKQEKYEVPFFENSDKLVTGSLEEEIFGESKYKLRLKHLDRLDELLKLAPDVIKILSETQRRRLLMNRFKGVPVRRIAEVEGVAFQVVHKSILGAEKKIKKYLVKNNLLP